MLNHRTTVIYVLLIFSVCLFAHHRLLSHPWTYDDLDHIAAAQRAQSDWTEIFSPQSKEPMRWALNIYFFLAYKIFGENPAGYHAINIPLHAINALLCAYLILKLFQNSLLAGLSGFLFAIHCAPYEAIYKISAAGLLFGTSAAILSVLFTKYHIDTKQPSYAIGAGCAYGIAILSYESLISICAPILYLWWTNKPRKYLLPSVVILPIISFVLLESTVYKTMDYKASFNAFAIDWHVPLNFVFFISRLFLNAHFTPFGWDGPPPFDIQTIYFGDYKLIGGLCVGLLSFFSLRYIIVRFATVWIFTTILPYIFSSNGFYFSRYWYLPSLGGALITAYIIVQLYTKLKIKQHYKDILFASFLAVVALTSFQKLFSYEGRFLTNAANFYLSHRNDTHTAIMLYEQAKQEYDIRQSLLYLNLAGAYTKTEQWEKAREHIEIVIHKRPNYANGYRSWGYILYKQEHYELAINAFTKASTLDHTFIPDFHELANRLYQKGSYSNALKAYQEILTYHPNYEQIHMCYLNISKILFHYQHKEQAIEVLQELLRIRPNYQEAQAFLEELFKRP